jgi:ABC-type transporter Mla subunit MlaD
MFTGILLFARSIFSRIFGDWKILLLVTILIFGGLIGYKIHSLEKNLKVTSNLLEIEKGNNKTLRGNILEIENTNKDNQKTIENLVKEKQLILDSNKKLSDSIEKTSKSFNEISIKLNTIKDQPTKLSPYLINTIDEIQKERAKQ